MVKTRETVRHIAAGPRALEAVSSLLGLKNEGESGRLDGMCRLGDKSLRLDLSLPGRRLVLYLGSGMTATAEGATGPAVRKFLRLVEARLGKRTFAELVALVENDPDSFVENIDPGRRGDRVKVPCIGQPIELLEAGWRNFYADQDFEVLLGVPSCTSDRTVNIEYADLECYYARPQRSFGKWTFLDWPEESEGGSRDGRGDADDGGDTTIVTELEERDMIMGTGERADALVAEVRKRAKDGNFLLFTHLCTPIIMGEDFQGLAKRCEKEVSGTSVRWSQKDRDDNDNFGEHFRALLGRPGFLDGPGDAGRVNLFHFPERCREAELKPFLAGIGLKSGVSVFPDVSFPALEALPEARWQVFCLRSSYPTKVHELLAKSSRPLVYAPAPYGVRGTRDCLASVAAAAGKSAEFEAAWAAKLEGFLPSWEAMRREAAEHRLGFVVSEATLPMLTRLRYGHGAPLATMVREMGFGVDLFYYDLHGEPPELPPGLADARVAVFRAPWELQRALRASDCRAVYSDVVFDWRLSRAGKARFSGRDFEMGLDGAARTLSRLLTVCRLPFYRRYAEHLAGRKGGKNVL